MKPRVGLSALLLLTASALVVITASATGFYDASWWTVDGGGATSSDGGIYGLTGSIGQPDAGACMHAGVYSLMGGFLAGASATIGAPEVISISRLDPDPTGAASVDFSVVFSETVNGVDDTDFDLAVTGVSGAEVSLVSSGPADTYTVSVDTGSGDGTIRLDLLDDDSILSEGCALPLGGAGTGNGDFTAGEEYQIVHEGGVSISGNAGIGGATLSYDDGGPQTVTAAAGGDYVISVPFNWTGTVTPSKPGYSFDPTQRDYLVDVTEDIIGEDYIATLELPTINRFYPTANSTACRRPLVGVDLLLTEIVRTASGSFNASKVTLKLDGVNVTNQAQIRVNMTHPASRATILYQPTADLTLATHQVQFSYPGASGPVTETWNFSAANIGCGT